ncbi:MAG: hypothetical protein PHI77_03855 [Candidatus Pacebacteria bacterium]|nr:hypothetical protein [Candidatus Paceibacterota bacterium]
MNFSNFSKSIILIIAIVLLECFNVGLILYLTGSCSVVKKADSSVEKNVSADSLNQTSAPHSDSVQGDEGEGTKNEEMENESQQAKEGHAVQDSPTILPEEGT